jgi:hypothetical protein
MVLSLPLNHSEFQFQHQYNKAYLSAIIVGLFLAVLGFELRALHLPGRYSTTLAMPLAPFALYIFEIGAHIYVPGQSG